MSMRIEGQMDAKIAGNTRAAGTRSGGPENTTGHVVASSQGTDNVSLSGVSGLAELAKSLALSDKQTKVAALTSQIRSGQYRPDASEISRAVVQGSLSN